MRVLVVGAYGLIGSYVAARLHQEGHAVVAAGRDRRAGARLAFATWRAADLARMRQPEAWLPHLAGIEAIVNCAGALQASPRDDLRGVHVEGANALYRAAVAAGIRRIVHVSAAGVGATPTTEFTATKLEAETALRALDADWIILRPGLVLAPSAYGGTALLRGLAAFPGIIPAVHARSIVQVISVEDVARAVARALDPATPARLAFDLVTPERHRFADVLVALRAWLGLPRAPVLSLPPALAAACARLADGLAYLGWRSPMRSTAIAQLRAGVSGDPQDAPRLLGGAPASLAQMLAGWPAGVQERWFAKLYFVKPTALVTLAAFWLASGVLGLARLGAAAAVLAAAGWAPRPAAIAVIGGAVVDIALAALACFPRTAPLALRGMMLASIFYLAAGSLARPDLWADPLGPFLKVLPGAVLALAALGMMDER